MLGCSLGQAWHQAWVWQQLVLTLSFHLCHLCWWQGSGASARTAGDPAAGLLFDSRGGWLLRAQNQKQATVASAGGALQDGSFSLNLYIYRELKPRLETLLPSDQWQEPEPERETVGFWWRKTARGSPGLDSGPGEFQEVGLGQAAPPPCRTAQILNMGNSMGFRSQGGSLGGLVRTKQRNFKGLSPGGGDRPVLKQDEWTWVGENDSNL